MILGMIISQIIVKNKKFYPIYDIVTLKGKNEYIIFSQNLLRKETCWTPEPKGNLSILVKNNNLNKYTDSSLEKAMAPHSSTFA